jgi:glycosyltransferase involved in cell wall biosynthesis
MPLLTIVTINKDDDQGVARTLASFAPIRAIDAIEFLFIDGASQDRSLEIARSFYEESLTFSAPDRGIYDAMNKGIDRASGTYLIFINSGDQAVPEGFAELLSILSATNADMLLFSAYSCDDFERTHCQLIRPSPERIPLFSHVHSSIVYRRQCLQALGGYISCFPVVADRESMLAFYFAKAKLSYEMPVISVLYGGGVSSQWPAEIEHDQLCYDYRVIGLPAVYRRCRRWLGVPRSLMKTLAIALSSPFRRRRIHARMSQLKQFLAA